MTSSEHRLEGSLEGTSGGGISYIIPLHFMVLFLMYFFYVLWFYCSNYGGCTQVVSFFKYRQCIITVPVLPTACLRVRCTKYAITRSVHQPLAYASSAL